MAKALKCEYEVDIPEFSIVSSEARDLVERLLVANPEERLTADDCLSHPWLSGQSGGASSQIMLNKSIPGDVIYIDVINELETTWMRRCLARRRYGQPDYHTKPPVFQSQNKFFHEYLYGGRRRDWFKYKTETQTELGGTNGKLLRGVAVLLLFSIRFMKFNKN